MTKFAGDFFMNNEKNNPSMNFPNVIKDLSKKQLIKKKPSLSWFAVTDEFLKDMQKEHEYELTTTDFKMLAYMLQKMDYNNICEIPNQKKIEQKLGISVRSISNAMKHLKERKYITRDNRLTRTFMLNPNYFYRGGLGPQRNKKRQFQKFYDKNKKTKSSKIDSKPSI